MAFVPRSATFFTAIRVAVVCYSFPLVVGQAFTKGGLRGAPSNVTLPELRELLLSYASSPLGDAPRTRLSEIEASIASTYAALPKNEVGRLSQRGVRYLVHHYFAKNHGWLISGLEPHSMRDDASQVHEVAILQKETPELIQDLLGQGHMDAGLSLRDVAAMAALIERLLMNDAAQSLDRAYEFNGHTTLATLDESNLMEVISSYLILFHRRNDDMTAAEHQLFKELARQDSEDYYASLEELGRDVVRNYIFTQRWATNLLAPAHYGFQTASQIVDQLLHRFGKWQNEECQLMKDDLMGLDPHGTGLVLLKTFYAHESPHGYLFHESIEYLRQIGAVDESAPGVPQVRLANYILGPSNCVASSSYLSLCCISECEVLMGELEAHVRAPEASPARLLSIVANLSTSSVDAPRELPQALEARLEGIAARNGGAVPLHGRLFAEWLHVAFPRECPYPHIVEDASVLTAEHFDPTRHAVRASDRCQDGGCAVSTEAAGANAPSLPQAVPRWSDEEVLPLLERPSSPLATVAGGALRLLVLFALCGVVLRTAWRSGGAAATAACARSAGLGKHRGKSAVPL